MPQNASSASPFSENRLTSTIAPSTTVSKSTPDMSIAEMPPRVEYELTTLGTTLTEPLGALGRWAQHHFDEVQQSRDAFDERHDA